jgi:hypothetical protein
MTADDPRVARGDPGPPEATPRTSISTTSG